MDLRTFLTNFPTGKTTSSRCVGRYVVSSSNIGMDCSLEPHKIPMDFTTQSLMRLITLSLKKGLERVGPLLSGNRVPSISYGLHVSVVAYLVDSSIPEVKRMILK
jgi:hypothetical protein